MSSDVHFAQLASVVQELDEAPSAPAADLQHCMPVHPADTTSKSPSSGKKNDGEAGTSSTSESATTLSAKVFLLHLYSHCWPSYTLSDAGCTS